MGRLRRSLRRRDEMLSAELIQVYGGVGRGAQRRYGAVNLFFPAPDGTCKDTEEFWSELVKRGMSE